MPKVNAPLYSVNGGEVGDEAMGRLDLERMRFAGSLYRNVLPRIVGSMTLRPGLEHITYLDYTRTKFLEFGQASGVDYLPVLTDSTLRVLKDDEFITRPAVDTQIESRFFDNFTGWTDESTGGASAGVSGGYLELEGASFHRAIAAQTISVASGDRDVEHALAIEITRGPIVVELGSTDGECDLICQTLEDGDHSIAFTPTTANIYLKLYNENNRLALVERCSIEPEGVMALLTPYTGSLKQVRTRKAVDTIYTAFPGFQQREIYRNSPNGWSVQRYKTEDGPFSAYTGEITMTPSVLTGNGTLTSSQPYFESSMTGRLFRLTQSGQTVEAEFDAEEQEGSYIRVSGVDDARKITYSVSGTFVGTWTLQVATDDGTNNPTGWTDVATGTGVLGATTHTDTDDNVIKFFRFVVKLGEYTSGTIETSLVYAGGSQDGVVRMTGYNSSTEIDVEVLDQLYSTGATSLWDHSMWSDYDGWPTTVEVFGGRLFWGRIDTMFGSVSDSYYSFDNTIEGNSAPIIRSLNSGGHDGVLWTLALQRLLAGTDVAEVSVRSSAFDEPLTSANWFPLAASTQGSYDVAAVKTDTDGLYVGADGTTMHRLAWDAQAQDYASQDLNQLHESICDGSPIRAIAIQKKPDTILWMVLEDGTARALTYEPSENVIAWSRVVTDGDFKDVATIKGAPQDKVYFVVSRGGVKRIEKMAAFSECKGGVTNCLADGFTRFSDTARTTFSVPHLDGMDVTVWGDGEAIHDQDNLYTVTDGVVELDVAKSDVIIGLPYTGDFVSTKLAYGAQLGTALFQMKRVSQLGLYLINTILDGLTVGRDENNMFKFTTTKDDAPVTPGELQTTFDAQMGHFSGDWASDSRVHIKMKSPYPCTVGGLAMQVKTNETG